MERHSSRGNVSARTTVRSVGRCVNKLWIGASMDEIDKVVMKDIDPKAAQEHWVFLEEFCYVCLEKQVYIFCQTPVPRLAVLCCGHCRTKFQSKSDHYIQRHNDFMKYLQEEEKLDHKGAVDRALRRVLNPDPSIR